MSVIIHSKAVLLMRLCHKGVLMGTGTSADVQAGAATLDMLWVAGDVFIHLLIY